MCGAVLFPHLRKGYLENKAKEELFEACLWLLWPWRDVARSCQQWSRDRDRQSVPCPTLCILCLPACDTLVLAKSAPLEAPLLRPLSRLCTGQFCCIFAGCMCWWRAWPAEAEAYPMYLELSAIILHLPSGRTFYRTYAFPQPYSSWNLLPPLTP